MNDRINIEYMSEEELEKELQNCKDLGAKLADEIDDLPNAILKSENSDKQARILDRMKEIKQKLRVLRGENLQQ